MNSPHTILNFLKNIKHSYLDDTHMPLPLASVSGVGGAHIGILDWMRDTCALAIVTSKSIQLTPNKGNREPIITEQSAGCYGNAVGLANKGLTKSLDDFKFFNARRKKQLHSHTAGHSTGHTAGHSTGHTTGHSTTRLSPSHVIASPLFSISLAANSTEDFETLIDACCPYADMIELNLSCPHARSGYGSAIGARSDRVAKIVTHARKRLYAYQQNTNTRPLLAIKLTPNIKDIGIIAHTAQDAGADVLVAINTLGPYQYREHHTRAPILTNPPGGYGGLSGICIKDTALRAINQIRTHTGTHMVIIGTGGVTTKKDVDAMIDAGADIVGIGSALARVHQKDWPSYFYSLTHRKKTISHIPSIHASLYTQKQDSLTKYTPIRVQSVNPLVHIPAQTSTKTPYLLYCQQNFSCELGQMLFLWIPDIGEKPYVPLCTNPLCFLIYPRGLHSTSLTQLQSGDTLYIRGPYGSAPSSHRFTDSISRSHKTKTKNLKILESMSCIQNLCIITETYALARVFPLIRARLNLDTKKKAHNSYKTNTQLLSDIPTAVLTRIFALALLDNGVDNNAKDRTVSHTTTQSQLTYKVFEHINTIASLATDFIHDHTTVKHSSDNNTALNPFLYSSSTHDHSAYHNYTVHDTHAFILAGTQKFLSHVLSAVSLLATHPHCWVSVETHTSCGIGLCGACALGSKLTCHYGTYMRATEFLFQLNTYGDLYHDS